jgi:excisionase family DNA binding protein
LSVFRQLFDSFSTWQKTPYFDLETFLSKQQMGNSAGFSKLNMNKKNKSIDSATPLPANTIREIFDDRSAAEYVGGLKSRAIRDWRMKRGLPFLRLTGKTIRIRKSDLDAWLNRQRTAITRGQA